jgi:membrane protein DedA with SNARE-associated domain
MFFPLNLSLPELIALLVWVFTGALGVPGSSLGIITFGTTLTTISSLIITIILVYIAVVAGDIFAYELAMFFSERFRGKLRHFSFFRDNEEKARNLLKKYEFYIVFFTRFALTGLCQVVSYVSGFERISRKKFILAVVTGEFLFAVIYVLIGFFLGEILSKWLSIINYSAAALVALFAIFYIIRYLVKKRRIRV